MLQITRLSIVVLGFIAFVSQGPPCAAQASLTRIVPEVSMDRTVFEAGEAVDVQVTFTNVTADTLMLLKWHTPFEGFRSRMFAVRWEGESVTYQGPVVKRGEPGPDDFMTLGPGESVSATVDLGEAYDVTVSGSYSVALRTVVPEVPSRMGIEEPPRLAARMLLSNEVAFQVVGGTATRPDRTAPESFLGTNDPTFTDCTAAQEAMITMAIDIARETATECLDFLCDLPVDEQATNENYVAWYGVWTAVRFAKVKSNWEAISNALSNESIAFECNGVFCGPSSYAYVIPDEPYDVFLCDLFFEADLSEGVNTKMGTLIHEISHFDDVAGLEDYADGVEDAKDLAANDPVWAIQNADNYEYFAETKDEENVECFLVVGDAPGDSPFLGGSYLFQTQLDGVEGSYEVLLEDIPEFVLPIVTAGRGEVAASGLLGGSPLGSTSPPVAPDVGDIPAWVQDGELVVQVLMWNPEVFPNQPEQYTAGLYVVIQPDGTVLSTPYGNDLGGMQIWHELDTNAAGQPVIRFPFSIPGFDP